MIWVTYFNSDGKLLMRMNTRSKHLNNRLYKKIVQAAYKLAEDETPWVTGFIQDGFHKCYSYEYFLFSADNKGKIEVFSNNFWGPLSLCVNNKYIRSYY